MRIGFVFRFNLIVAALTLACGALTAHADASDKRVALVIGNSAYENTTPLRNPSNDATDIASLLNTLGFQVFLGVDLDKTAMDRKIADFAEALAGADAGVFFYAGHGLQVGGSNYLMPVNSTLLTPSSLDFEMVKLDLVQRAMEHNAQASIIFLDACRDNPLARNLARALSRTRGVEISRGLAAVESGIGTLISFSTQPGNVALDGDGRNSPFAAALVKHLHDEGSLTDLLISVRNDVLAATEERQVPWEHSALRSNFYFNRPKLPSFPEPTMGASSPYEQEAELALWKAISVNKSPELLASFLRQFPNGRFAPTARIMADALEVRSSPAEQVPEESQAPLPPATLAALDENVVVGAPAAPGREDLLTRLLQKELKRIGCYDGDIDGRWGDATRAGLETFAKEKGLSLATAEPTQALLEMLSAQREQVCAPQPRASRKSEATRPSGRRISGLPNGSRTLRERVKGRDCTPMNGPYGRYENLWCK